MKKKRHEIILDYIKSNNISTQEEIIEKLKENGFNVTQATISRDIKELKLIKEHYGKNNTRYAVSEKNDNDDNFKMIFARSALIVEEAVNIVVIKCYSGTANAACIALDGMSLEGIVGTIAGDDTIFAACKDSDYAHKIKNHISAMLKE